MYFEVVGMYPAQSFDVRGMCEWILNVKFKIEFGRLCEFAGIERCGTYDNTVSESSPNCSHLEVGEHEQKCFCSGSSSEK